MKKITLNALALYIGILSAFSQQAPADTGYTAKKLKVSEVNLVTAYYTQNGNHSAVTGGIGTEKLTDISNTIEVKLARYDKRLREHNLNIEIGIDHYTSASSDKIDPSTISSASYSDNRFYPSVGYSIKNNNNGLTLGVSGSYSNEYDYVSKGFGVNLAKASKDNNRELSVKLQAYLDSWKVILPIELRNGRDSEGRSPRNSYSASFVLSQVVNQRLQLALLADLVTQNGLLGTSYQRVYYKNGSVNYEHLPDSRLKIPVGIRAAYFASDRLIIRPAYRFYTDDWGVRAHTADLEMPIKINPFFSVAPFYRYYTQTAADYFAPYKAHDASATFFTSDYDLSRFSSQFVGAGLRLTPANGIFGVQKWASAELRYGYYSRSEGLHSSILTLHLKFR